MLQVTFDHPAALVSLAAALVPVALAYHARRRGLARRPAGVILQCMALLAGGLAVAGPAMPLGREVEKPYLLLQDGSASVRGQSAEPIPWPQGLGRQDYSFAAGVSPADAPLDKGASLDTRAAPALLLAAAKAPDVAGVIIRTDGQFHDDWPGAAAALGRTGISVLVAAMDSPPPVPQRWLEDGTRLPEAMHPIEELEPLRRALRNKAFETARDPDEILERAAMLVPPAAQRENFRWWVLDNHQVRVWLPQSSGRYALRRSTSYVDLMTPYRDPCLHLTELFVWENNNPWFQATNPMAVNQAVCRIMAMGFRFITSKLTAEEISRIKAGKLACTYIVASGNPGRPH